MRITSKISMILCVQLIYFSLFEPFALSDEETELKPRKKETSHYYRDTFFVSDEGQSCNDISDHRKIQRRILFCRIDPIPETLTTLSFWGWDNIKGNNTGSVQVYTVSNFNEELFLFEVLVSKDNSDKYIAKWYRHDFELNGQTSSSSSNISSYITKLNLYYYVPEGQHNEINLRDVWMRSTPTDSKLQTPPRSCSLILHNLSIWIFYFIFLSYPISIFVYCYPKFTSIKRHRTKTYIISGFFIMITVVMLAAYTDGYPGVRCKNDDYLIGIVIFAFVSTILCYMLSFGIERENDSSLDPSQQIQLHQNQNQNFDNFDPSNLPAPTTAMTRRSRREALRANRAREIEVDVIKIASQNSRRTLGKKKQILSKSISSNPLQNKRKVYNGGDNNECSICMESYTHKRPGVVIECGHVWCSHCVKEICVMTPPHHTGSCPTCRSTVSLKNVVLFNPDMISETDEETGEGGGGGGGGECMVEMITVSNQDVISGDEIQDVEL